MYYTVVHCLLLVLWPGLAQCLLCSNLPPSLSLVSQTLELVHNEVMIALLGFL